ncbi:MAG: glycosyltransferase [Candidatus Paceibacterota bacterium]|jgi:cellulose synthase/poly-beta-1,6-N-acetylglucosamine synthase-like glycosyltransferase
MAWGPDVYIYPFIFVALYFESFLLVTFLSKPARARRIKSTKLSTPNVAIIVPCWNEETTIAGTVESLLALEYPKEKLSLILINDGSTDATPSVIDRFAEHPQITTIHKENGGKFTAMNIGIEHAKDAELIGFLDAVAPDSLREVVAAFDEPGIAAITSSMSIHKPQTLFQRMQYAEYSLSITLRHVFASINGLYVAPGPFSFYRRTIFADIGMFKHAYLAEDMEMAMRIQRAGMSIGNAIRARVYTKGPSTFPKLLTQRIRWTTGFLRNILFDYRDLLGNKKNKVLGILVLPFAIYAVIAGISLFFYGIYQTITHGLHTVSMIQTVPLSYLFSWHPFTWFYLPITIPTLLGAALMLNVFIWMMLGKHLSKTPGKLALNVVIFIALYGIVAPVWLIRSVSDVALGTRTPWR